MLYDHVYLLLEFQTGERYLENLPPLPYPAKMVKLDYNDMDGNAFLDPWIIVELAEGVGRNDTTFIPCSSKNLFQFSKLKVYYPMKLPWLTTKRCS